MKIEIVDHREEWKDMFEEEKKNIVGIVNDNLVNIFHIGSSSVEGLKSKPIIDILLVVRDLDKLDNISSDFEDLGYEVMGEYGISKRRFYKKSKTKRTHHIHAFKYDNIFEIERHLLYRDYLRVNETRRKEYGELKSKLALEYTYDIDGYCEGKNDFVKKVEREALIWHFENRDK